MVAFPAMVSPADSPERSDRLLYDFASVEAARRFRPINDAVMGGVSRGDLVALEGGGAAFCGTVSLENNGGFASVRSEPEDHRLAGYAGITLTVTGDGKIYKIALKTSAALDGIQYQASCQPPARERVHLKIPFSSFVPTFRGKLLDGVPPLEPARISTVGIMISGG
jgi:NADH dehydrogenase [ubiquinone] 1 alpha subcomplex assembly factor 1